MLATDDCKDAIGSQYTSRYFIKLIFYFFLYIRVYHWCIFYILFISYQKVTGFFHYRDEDIVKFFCVSATENSNEIC